MSDQFVLRKKKTIIVQFDIFLSNAMVLLKSIIQV